METREGLMLRREVLVKVHLRAAQASVIWIGKGYSLLSLLSIEYLDHQNKGELTASSQWAFLRLVSTREYGFTGAKR
jgi:hypothetical protein